MEAIYSIIWKPSDNVCMESFRSVLERKWLERDHLSTCEDTYKKNIEYVEMIYNTIRIHGSCGYLTPNVFEKQKYHRIK